MSDEYPPYDSIRVERRGIAAYVTLARPDVHNAFNARLIAELTAAFTLLDGDDTIRADVLQGEGRNFCAGADLTWMGASLQYSHDENIADALRMSDMFRAIDSCRHPVIGRIQGFSLGGGSGLAAVCDLVVAAENSTFGFTEARLGIAPAVISPLVVKKIGESHARALFVTAERFDTARALAIGLAHKVAPADQLDSVVEAVLRDIGQSGPMGVRAAKLMARTVSQLEPDEARETSAATIADLRTSPEGQEGIRAFLDKRRASWVSDDV